MPFEERSQERSPREEAESTGEVGVESGDLARRGFVALLYSQGN